MNTRISTRPCPPRQSELLRQGGVHPVLARIYAARGLLDVRELSCELTALVPPSGLKHIDAAAVFLADAIAALADTLPAGPADFVTHIDGDAILYCASVAAHAVGADWGGWIARMQQLEAALFAPILESLKKGRVRTVRLVLSQRDAHAEFSTTALAQRSFWRRPNLDRLL